MAKQKNARNDSREVYYSTYRMALSVITDQIITALANDPSDTVRRALEIADKLAKRIDLMAKNNELDTQDVTFLANEGRTLLRHKDSIEKDRDIPSVLTAPISIIMAMSQAMDHFAVVHGIDLYDAR